MFMRLIGITALATAIVVGTSAAAWAVPVPDAQDEAGSTSLQYMRQEEQLARDLYVELGEIWGDRVFVSIAGAEQRHFDAVGRLLDVLGIDDPASGEAGVFADAGLQSRYDELLERGSRSLEDALLVGALVEEVDILDLTRALASTDDPTATRLLGALLRGSQSHLRAFVRRLDAIGVDYAAQEMSEGEVASILSGGSSGRQQSASRGPAKGRGGRGR